MVAILTISVFVTLAGARALLIFNGTAGVETAGPVHWPEGTAVERSRTALTMLVLGPGMPVALRQPSAICISE